MNAPIPPNDPARIDELISAYVDGVAAPDEIAIVESNDKLMGRVESMRSVSAMLGASVTPPADAVREDHLAAALGEFDLLFGDGATDKGTGATVTPLPQPPLPQPAAEPELVAASAPALEQQAGVTSLAEARERKRPRRLNMVAAAAAAVAILFAGVVAVGLNTGGETTDVVAEASSDAIEPAISSAIESSDQMVLPEEAEAAPAPTAAAARAFEDAMADDAGDAMEEAAMDDDAMDESMADEEAMEEEADAEAAFAAPVEDSDADAAGATQSQPVGFLGSFATINELATAAHVDLNEVPAAKTALDRSAFLGPTDCIDIAQELTGLEVPTLLSTAFLDGNPVELHAAGDGQILVLSSTDCTTIESIPAP